VFGGYIKCSGHVKPEPHHGDALDTRARRQAWLSPVTSPHHVQIRGGTGASKILTSASPAPDTGSGRSLGVKNLTGFTGTLEHKAFTRSSREAFRGSRRAAIAEVGRLAPMRTLAAPWVKPKVVRRG